MSVEVTKSKLFLKYSNLPFSFIKMQMHSIDFVPSLSFPSLPCSSACARAGIMQKFLALGEWKIKIHPFGQGERDWVGLVVVDTRQQTMQQSPSFLNNIIIIKLYTVIRSTGKGIYPDQRAEAYNTAPCFHCIVLRGADWSCVTEQEGVEHHQQLLLLLLSSSEKGEIYFIRRGKATN